MRKVTTLTGKNLPRLAVAKPGWPAEPKSVEFSESLVRQIAMDVGKQVVAHIEYAYPEMLRSVAAKSASLSIRNTAYNAIMEAIKAADIGEVETMLERHDTHRRTMRKFRKGQGDGAMRGSSDADNLG